MILSFEKTIRAKRNYDTKRITTFKKFWKGTKQLEKIEPIF